MIGVSEQLIRPSGRASVAVHGGVYGVDRGVGRYGGGGGAGGGLGEHASDSSKLLLIDNLLASSPPLPAPPVMQPAQILAQERELEQQMNRLHMQRGSAAATAHRTSISILTIDPVYAVPAPPPQAAQQSALSAKSRAPAPAPAPTSDWFAKVEVAPRAVAPVSSSFVPSRLSVALTDSGVLFRQAATGRTGTDDFARVSSRDQRSSGGSGGGRGVAQKAPIDTITIFLHPFSDVAVRPARIRLQLPPQDPSALGASSVSPSNPSTEDVLASLLQKWCSGELRNNFGLRAELQPMANTTKSWNLKMIDEDTIDMDEDDSDDDDADASGEGRERMGSDEEVGMPEEDLPPLERSKPVRMFGVHFLAMVLADGCTHTMPPVAASSDEGESPPPPPPPIAQVPTSPTAAAAATTATDKPSVVPPTTPIHHRTASRHTISTPSRGDMSRVTPTHGTTSTTPGSGSGVPGVPKMRTVSVFSGPNTTTVGAIPRPTLNTTTTPTTPVRDHRAATIETSHTPSPLERRHISQHALSHDPSRLSVFGPGPTSPQSAQQQKFYLKIHIGDHESHILGMFKHQTLAEALPMLSAKKHALTEMKPDRFRFFYLDPLLKSANASIADATRVSIGELASDELNLVPILGPGPVSSSDEPSTSAPSAMMPTEAPSVSSFQFSLDTASNYCEYKVVKTNQRGKRQHRIFGVDRYKIYNKTQSGADDAEGGMFSFIQKRIISEQSVSRAYRMINTIASVHVVSLRPTCFCINFKSDARKDSPIAQSREYETETKMECAEIVAKLRFLMQHAGNDPTHVVGSVATGGMLAQSMK